MRLLDDDRLRFGELTYRDPYDISPGVEALDAELFLCGIFDVADRMYQKTGIV